MRSQKNHVDPFLILGLLILWGRFCIYPLTSARHVSLDRIVASAVIFSISIICSYLARRRKQKIFLIGIGIILGGAYLTWGIYDPRLALLYTISAGLGFAVGASLSPTSLPPLTPLVDGGPFGTDTPPLQLRQMRIYAKEFPRTRYRFFRSPITYNDMCIYCEVNGRKIRFTSDDFTYEAIKSLLDDPSFFLTDDEPVLCGLGFEGSQITEVAEKNLVPAGSLIITDYVNLLGTIYPDEVPVFQQWILRVFH